MNRADKLAIAQRDNWTCQAHGLHHDLCPGTATDATAQDFSVHHIYTQARGRREGISKADIDRPENLILVWNRYPLGCNGCHLRIHRESDTSTPLGLLADEWEGS